MKNIIVTAAYPFIPARLNMAHMASTYVPADVYARFIKLLGYNCQFVSATDIHGISIQNLFKSEKKSNEEIIEEFDEYYKECFRALDIQYDTYLRTDTPEVKTLVYQSLEVLREKGYIKKHESDNYLCKTCNEYLPKRFRVQGVGVTATNKLKLSQDEAHLKCAFCGSEDIELQHIEHWFLDLNKGEKLIEKFVEEQNDKVVKNYLISILKQGLKEWDFTREHYFGLQIPFEDTNKYIYLWYESLVAYLTLFNYKEGPYYFKHFMGKNIVYYHGIIWPILLEEGLNVNVEGLQICAKGFMDVSQSEENLIDIKKAMSLYHKDYIRFYAIYRVPNSFNDFYFTEENFKQVINSILCQQVGGFFKRCRSILYKNNLEVVPDIEVQNNAFTLWLENESIPFYEWDINNILKSVIEYIKSCGNEIEKYKIYLNPTVEKLRLLCEMLACGLLLMAPFIPNLVNDYNIFEGLSLDSLGNRFTISGRRILVKDQAWRKIDD